MKKRILTLLSLLFTTAVLITGCKQDESELVTVPDTLVENITSEEKPSFPQIKDDPSKEQDPTDEKQIYPYWWELHDYHLDQQDLASDAAFKNLTIQPGDTPDSLNITWFSQSSSKGNVTFTSDTAGNISANAVTQPSTSVPGYYRNSAVIKGLSSNTLYRYTLKNGGNTSPVYQYETQDLFSTDFTFTIAGDPEIGLGDEELWDGHRSIWRVVLNRMKSQIPNSSFLITMGDQVANPSSSVHYDYFLDNSVLYSTTLVPLVGNHDNGTGYFGDHFSLPNLSSIGAESGRDGDYWFVRGNVLFMVLNSMCPLPAETHEEFVAEAIAANPDAKWRIVLSHYSPITMVERYQGTRESIQYVYPYIAEHFDIDLFIGGHDHIYTRGYFLDRDGDPIMSEKPLTEIHNPDSALYMIVSGSTDALLREPDNDYPWSALSVQNGVPQLTEVHVTENSLNVVTHDADSWAIVDDFTIYKD